MPEKLIEGLKRFRRDSFPRYRERYQRLVAEGQKPSSLFIGCADSRVVPDLITDSEPGSLFILRNVGNLVPPFEASEGYYGTAAGIEFAVLQLGVKDIVVCGHSHCGAIAALYAPPNPLTPNTNRWLSLAREAKLEGAADEAVLRRTEKRSIVIQVERLLSYPMVVERVEAGTLGIHGWYYVIEDGQVLALNVGSGEFTALA
jgi:carbonic anhydrase